MSKVCVVAGVGPGNGASCCRRFAAEGYSIVMLARNADYLASLSAQLPGSLPIACDVRDPEAIETAFDRIRGEAGEVDVLIYNAGSGEWNSVEETTIEGMARASGSIVVIGATASLRGGANSTAFASAKSAQRSLAQSMARRLGPTGIHVSYVIIDGIIDLERTRAARPDIPDEYYLQPDDIAQSVYDLTCQHRSAWTFELDLRPFGEKW